MISLLSTDSHSDIYSCSYVWLCWCCSCLR